MSVQYVLVNFGGPRNLDEIEPFLKTLLRDRDVIRTKLPQVVHHVLFGRIAKRRAKKVEDDYRGIGGKSPIYEDTEKLAKVLSKKLGSEVWTFHRYLPMTHSDFFRKMKKSSASEFRFFPLFPQFSYATTGSIARMMKKRLPEETVSKIHWQRSYPDHPGFIKAHQKKIREFLNKKKLKEKDTILLFSSHGVPQTFVNSGDTYQRECEVSFRHIISAFPEADSWLSYQSKFGPGEWLRPYTVDMCETLPEWKNDRKHLIFIPLSFTSDHIETLFEIEKEYLQEAKKHLDAYRLDALNFDETWIDAICDMLKKKPATETETLIREKV